MSRLLDRLLIVPESHTRVFHARFQATIYDAFHRDWRCNLTHRLCTPIALLSMMVLVSAQWPEHAIVATAAVAAPVLVWSLVLAPATAPIVGLALVGFAALAQWLALALPSPSLIGLGGVVVAVALQTMSHMFEPVPPPLSGSDEFVDFVTYQRRGGWPTALRGFILFLLAYFWLELWAVPRVFAVQCQEIFFALGYRPELARSIRGDADRYLARPLEWLRELRSGG